LSLAIDFSPHEEEQGTAAEKMSAAAES